ncbi:MAG: hypothetical protein NT080_05545 [Spirochaetes bacterium]|nr:hypothetical protein [Spirochaetota bacterium]
MTRRRTLAACAILAFAGAAFAQNLGPRPDDRDWSFGLAGLRVWKGFVPSGLDLEAGWYGFELLEGTNTVLYSRIGGGYQNKALTRDPLSGDPILYEDAEFFDSPNFQWELGIAQGLVGRDDGSNLVEAFLYYRGRCDIYLNDLPTDVFADAGGIFGTSFLAGIGYDSTGKDAHGLISGLLAEGSFEYGPGALNAELSDFWRANAKAAGFLPLFDLDPGAARNLLNAYLAGFASADRAGGNSVPMYVNQSFGGRDLRDSLGDCVRGYRWTSYDAEIKVVGNLEARFVGPALGLPAILPVLYGFFDAGWYSGFADADASVDDSGSLASAGGGAAIDLLGVAQVGAWASYRLVEDDYEPGKRFNWGMELFLHF